MLQVIPNYFSEEQFRIQLALANQVDYETVSYQGTDFPSIWTIHPSTMIRRYVKGEKQKTVWHTDESLGKFITIVGLQEPERWNGGTAVQLPDGQVVLAETWGNTAIRFPAAWIHRREPVDWEQDYPRQIFVTFDKGEEDGTATTIPEQNSS
jgi:hypothetical protein